MNELIDQYMNNPTEENLLAMIGWAKTTEQACAVLDASGAHPSYKNRGQVLCEQVFKLIDKPEFNIYRLALAKEIAEVDFSIEGKPCTKEEFAEYNRNND